MGATLIAALVIVLVHLFGQRFYPKAQPQRRAVLSAAGGVAVAYVFLHLLPELGHLHRQTQEAALVETIGIDVYVVALAGLALFYGLEQRAARERSSQRRERASYWLHIASFAAYDALVGYLLPNVDLLHADRLAHFTVAMALHLEVNDHALREHHQRDYDRVGRWFLAGALLGGWGLGMLVQVSDALVAMLFAFLAGAVVLNVLKEELPEGRQGHFAAFAIGAAAYGLLLVWV